MIIYKLLVIDKMNSHNEQKITELVKKTPILGLDRHLDQIGRLSSITIDNGKCNLDIVLGFYDKELTQYKDFFCNLIRKNSEIGNININITSEVKSHSVQSAMKPIAEVKNIIAVASGKGGVGKSTIASNLAISLHQDGAKVGILDADIYGPSLPLIFGIENERPTSNDNKRINPLISYGVEVMSIGFLIDASKPTVWRGPMVTSALNQLLKQTIWGNLDYLIIDMPPGTGDIQLSLSQQVPVSGSIIVTTPQNIALIDAKKGLEMFRKVSVPILGVVENMSTHICSNCQQEETIFGDGGGEKLSNEYDIDLLCSLPLNSDVRQQTDNGEPSVISQPNSVYSKRFREGAKKMAINLASMKKEYSQHFPKIVVEDN